MSCRNIRFEIAYDGSSFCGWQESKDGRSVEETLRCVLERVVGAKVVLQVASRTDSGVHAAHQVGNFYAECADLDKLLYAARRLLPPDISLLSLSEVPESFHPTLDNRGKIYHYSIATAWEALPWTRATSWHLKRPLNVSAMQEAAKLFLGEHDFLGFCNRRPEGKPEISVCQVRRLDIVQEPNGLRFEIEGNRFLYKMVRNLVGTLVDIGCGKLSKQPIIEALRTRDRKLVGQTAPANGLTLYQVLYDKSQ